MSHNVYTIKLAIDTKQDAISQHELVEIAMNLACTYIENAVTHEYISYKIYCIDEID